MSTISTYNEEQKYSSTYLRNGFQKLIEMGFDEDQALLAMERYNDIDTAVQHFLIMESINSDPSNEHKSVEPKTVKARNDRYLTKQYHHNNQDIVDKLKYRYSHTVSEYDLSAGDHIYCWRKYAYAHHGIYIGNGKVIHFCGEITNTEHADIIENSLREFLKDDTLKRVKYDVSDKYFALCRAGTSNTLKKDDTKLVVSRAKSALGTGKGKYNAMEWNCETFCLWCTLGNRYMHSIQSTVAAIGIEATLGGIVGGILGGPPGAAFGATAAAALMGHVISKSNEKKQKEYKPPKLERTERGNIEQEKRNYNERKHYSNEIARLIAMGFEENMSVLAMEKYGNIDAAVQCLLLENA